MKNLIWTRITRINTDKARSMDNARRVSNGNLSLANTVLLHDTPPIYPSSLLFFTLYPFLSVLIRANPRNPRPKKQLLVTVA